MSTAAHEIAGWSFTFDGETIAGFKKGDGIAAKEPLGDTDSSLELSADGEGDSFSIVRSDARALTIELKQGATDAILKFKSLLDRRRTFKLSIVNNNGDVWLACGDNDALLVNYPSDSKGEQLAELSYNIIVNHVIEEI